MFMTQDEFLAVVQARIEGKNILMRLLSYASEFPWLPMPEDHLWNLSNYEYKIGTPVKRKTKLKAYLTNTNLEWRREDYCSSVPSHWIHQPHLDMEAEI